ncbi:MAG TPA: MOSC and FAD-binding oxidoreductase domain-containing protein [Pseudonocardia sp.]
MLLSVNVGMPKEVSWQGKTVYTGVWKHSVDGPRMARRLNIDGDGQGDVAGHGGEQRAVFVYQIDSYRHWQLHFGRDDFTYGQFGENLTVDGLPDDEVCIGDRYRIGDAEFEVTQPRVTCYRVGLRMGEPELPALLVSHHRPGFYLRVITEGHIEAGDPIVKTRTGPHALTVADVDGLLYLPGRDLAKLRLATQIPALSPGWLGSFRELVVAAEHAATTAGGRGSDGAQPTWPGFRPLRVSKVVREADAVSSIYLTAPDGSRLPDARPGQYLTLRISALAAPAPVRSYSLSLTPGADGYRISVKHEPHGTVSGYLTGDVRPGAVLDVAAPRGDFVLDDGTGPVLLVSAGIGVTPVLAMLHELAARRSDRAVWWIHGDRGPREQALAGEVDDLLAALPNAHRHVFWSKATPAELRSGHAEPGRLTSAGLAALDLPADADAYLCGPPSFMTDIQQALTGIGLAPARIHTEVFGALAAINPGVVGAAVLPPHQPSGPPGTGPLVTFARSGLSTPFTAGAGSLLELADACAVPSRWSCRIGVCHTCVTPLLSGEIAYSPDPLEPPADGQILVCCARPETDVVLDM